MRKAKKYNQTISENVVDGKIIDFIIPVGVLIALTVITGDLITAVIGAIVVCAIMYIPRKIISSEDLFPILSRGFSDMLVVDIVLLLTFVLQIINGKMGMTDYIIRKSSAIYDWFLVSGDDFCVGCRIVFLHSLASLPVCALVAPIAFPLGAILGVNTLLVMAAIMSGAGFGSHACFYSDATLVSSRIAGIDNLEHATSQLPYVIIAAAISLVAFIVAGIVI